MTLAGEAPSFRKRDYILALLFSAVERGGQTILLFVSSVFIARSVGPAAFGVASLALSFVLLLEAASERLFRDVIVQRQHLTEREIGAAISGAVLSSIALAACLAALSHHLADLFAMPDLRLLVPIAALSIVFAGSGGVLAALLHRRLDFKHLARRTLLGATVGAVVGIALAAAGFGGISLIAQYVVQSFTSLLAVYLSTKNVPRPNLDWRSLMPLLKFALPMAAAESLWSGAFRIFVAMAGYLSGAIVVAHLEMAMRFVQAVSNLWQSVVGPVALSLFTANQGDRDALRGIYRRLTAMNCLAALPVFAGMIVVAPDFILLALGEEWMPAATAMQGLALAAGLWIMWQFVSIIINAVGRPELNVPTAAGGLVGALAGLALLGPTGAAGAAFAWGARLFLAQPISMVTAWRAARLRPYADLWAPTFPATAASLGMVVVTMALDRWLWDAWPVSAQLAASIVCGFAVYAALVALLARPVLRDIWSLARDLRTQA